MMKHIALLLLFSLFWGLPAIGQETGSRKVTGYIVDSSGNPIAGATVKIKDTTTATISDGNGQFFVDGAELRIDPYCHIPGLSYS